MKKHLKWILPTLVAAVLLAAAAVLFVLFGGQKPQTEQPAQDDIKVYWNVDKDFYWDAENKISMRMKAGDNYRVRFAVGGEQIDLFVDNYETMNQIDSQKFMGLRVNEENLVTEVLKPHEFTGGLAVYEYYVVDIQDGLVMCNNLASGKGLPLKLRINENTEVYDVGGEGLLAGLPGQLEIGCQVYGVMGLDGYVSHLYVMPPFEPEPVYWNVERMYNSSAKVSTRQRDEAGYFTYEFIVDGEAVTLRTREVDVANQIDSFGAKCMHLEFDEDGLITEATHARNSTGGSSVASWYHVLRIDSVNDPDNIEVVANGFYAEKFSGSDKGKTAECTLADNVKIYDMSGKGAYLGEETELQLYDQVHCLTNPYGDVCIIFIISRPVEAELYYNLERKWDSKTSASTRTKSSDGYYYFEMAVNGQHVTLKTQDPGIVKTIDGRAAKVLGLEVEGDVITGAYVPSAVAGSQATVFDYCTVTDIATDGTVTAQRNGNTYSGLITADTKVYNVSASAGKQGEETTIKVGDKLYGFRDLAGNVTTVYVVGRQVDGPVYWNLDRSYDSKNKVTKRKPAEDGYYYFKLAAGTKTVTYKTKSKEIASTLDSYVAVALQLSGDVITRVYKYDLVKGCTGGGFASWCDVQSVSGSIVTAANSKETYTGTMAAGCVIYDVSQGSAAPVTRTRLQVGDRIHGVKNEDGKITAIYVVDRVVKADLYYNITRKWDDDKGITSRVPDAEGWYWFDMSVNGKQVRLKTDNIELVNAIDSRGAKVLGLKLDGDVITAAYKPSAVSGSEKTVFDYSTVTAIAADGTITTARNGETYTGKPASGCKVYNVTGTAAQIGELSKVKVGDKLYGLGNTKGQLTHIYIVGRQVQAQLYYNVDRLWADEASTRTPDAEGWYWFDMILDTKAVKLKTKDTNVVHVIDGRAAKVLGLEVEGDVITAAYKPSQISGSEKTIFDFADVKEIAADGTITATKSGKTVTGKLAEGCKIYNVSSAAGQLGEVSTVEVGDQIYGLGSDSEFANYVYVIKRSVKAQTKTALCQACNRNVEWTSWDGSAQLTGGHWYLTGNVDVKSTARLEGDSTVCLDLCGFKVNGSESIDRIFNIFCVFNLMDSVGTGKVTANYSNEAGRTGSVFYVQNSKTSGYGVFNLYGGTLTATGITKQGGIGGIANDFNMYGGTITGGKAAINGGNLYIEGTNDATVSIYGGTVTGGTANGLGGGIYAQRGITVGGTAQITGNTGSDVYLTGSHSFAIDGLESGASIGVTLANTYGTVATNAAETDVACFVSNAQLQITYADGKLSILAPAAEHEDHCICGGLGATGDHTCSTEHPVWEPWTGTWESGKYYYLTTDVTMSAEIRIELDQELNLCLNGFDITNSVTDRIFNIFGTLNLCDHKNATGGYDGQVISNYVGTSTRSGRVFYVQNKATFNLYGGNLISNSATQNGGTGGIAKNFNMYDGTISGGKATVTGGNIRMDGGTTTIYGGTITGGKSVNGGNIYVNSGKLVILGGQITGGEAQEQGGGIYSDEAVTVGGTANITGNTGSNLYLAEGCYVTLSSDDPLAEGANMGLTLAGETGVFCQSAAETDKAYFTADNGSLITYQDGTLVIGTEKIHTAHCICGGLGQVGGHTCDPENVPAWEPWTGSWESGKYYYLTADFDVEAIIRIEEDQILNLCLNGHDMIGDTAVTRIFNIFGQLNLCDHANEDGTYDGDVITNYDTDVEEPNTQTGRVFYIQNKTNACMNMYGGNLLSNSSTANGGIGGITRPFNMYAGTISGGTATGNGGNLMIENSTTVTLHGGTVTGGTAANGGNIYVKSSGKVVIDGGTVSGGLESGIKNANNGGNIYVDKGTVTLYGGTVTGGTAANGGNIYVNSSGTVVVDGGTISGGLESGVKNANNGGNIYVEKGTVTLISGGITGGYASNAGGSIRVQPDGVLNIQGGILSGGYAKGNGGNVYSQGTILMTGGTVSNGETAASKTGGNLYASGGSLTISDDPEAEGKPSVTGGKATYGGNIAIKVDGASVTGCTVSGGTADFGAEIYFENSGTLTVSGCGTVEVYAKTGTVEGDSDVTVTTP